MSDLLPHNATKQERALSLATARLASVDVPIRDLWNPRTCPVPYLPWLAWALSVDVWDPAWPTSVKREVIASSADIHRKKGTAGAVRAALSATGVPSEIIEWWQEGGTPHTFRVLVDVAALTLRGEVFGAALINEIRNSVIPVKPVRSHFAISAYYGAPGALYAGGAAVISQRWSIPPYLPTNFELEVDLPVAAVLVTNARVEVQ